MTNLKPDGSLPYSEEDISSRERSFGGALSGWLMLIILIVGGGALGGSALGGVFGKLVPVPIAIVVIATFIVLRGFFVINPNEAVVVQLAGRYVGSIRTAGFNWILPIYSRRKISLRVRNFESTQLKVNDFDGNPIEIACIVVWRVRDSAEAVFEVDDYVHYVRVQSEAALRNMATHHPYDAHNPGQFSLRGSTAEVAAQLKTEVQDRLDKAGVEVIEARISHLAYAPEIASAMLRRQQASAVISARQKIVEGAVGMVEMALNMLARDKIVDMDQRAKSQLVANLMVVLCSEHNVQPVVNAGHTPPPATSDDY